MAQPTNGEITMYMHQVVDAHVDPLTGELNLTALAEDALNEYPEYEDEELFFECAYATLQWYQRTRK